jgi:hypothetical protein
MRNEELNKPVLTTKTTMEKMKATSKHLIRKVVQKKIAHSGKAISNTPNLEAIEVERVACLVEKFGISKK